MFSARICQPQGDRKDSSFIHDEHHEPHMTVATPSLYVVPIFLKREAFTAQNRLHDQYQSPENLKFQSISIRAGIWTWCSTDSLFPVNVPIPCSRKTAIGRSAFERKSSATRIVDLVPDAHTSK